MPLVSTRALRPLVSQPGKWAIPAHLIAGRRVGGYKYISIQQTPSTTTASLDVKTQSQKASSPDATFEIIGSPYSLLSVTLTPSTPLHTRRGTLIGLTGNPEGVISTLRTLSPIRRALVGIPFLYQRLTSTTPTNLLISATRSSSSPTTSLALLHLDGTQDWRLAQRSALLAWTGNTLAVTPTINQSLTLAYWGSSDVTGRGLLALAGQGNIYSIDLAEGETYIAHPANILAYSTSGTSASLKTPLPTPYRFRSSAARFAVPTALGDWFPESRWVRALKTSQTWKTLQGLGLAVKRWSRRTIWGDRLFLRFEGPTTLLLQSRANRVSEVLRREDVDEMAEVEAGSVEKTVRRMRIKEDEEKGRVVIGKSDAERMGVSGGQVSAQTDEKARKEAPQVVVPGTKNGASSK